MVKFKNICRISDSLGPTKRPDTMD